jgi:hypothetical protein
VVGNELELQIIAIFGNNLGALFSIHQVSKKLGKAYPHIYHKINELIDEGILQKVIIGRSTMCSINLDSEKAVFLLGLTKTYQKEQFSKKENLIARLDQIVRRIRLTYRLHTVVYSNKKVYFVLDHLFDKDSILNNFDLTYFNTVFVTAEEFQSMILNDQKLISDVLIIHAYEKYYEIVNHMKDKLLGASLFK